jgi:PAS domain S-box-containing protein
MHWVRPDGRILKANQAELDLLGYAREDYLGRNIADFHVDPQGRTAILTCLARGESLNNVPAQLRARDGSIRHVRVSSRGRIRDGEFVNTRCVTFDVTEAVRAEESLATRMAEQSALFDFTDALYRAETHADVYESAVDAILRALRCDRASVLLLDDSNTMRFVAWSGLSNLYREAVEGHSPWSVDVKDPQPISIANVEDADLSPQLRELVLSEGIRALSFVPVMADGWLAGKFMTYYDTPHLNSLSLLLASSASVWSAAVPKMLVCVPRKSAATTRNASAAAPQSSGPCWNPFPPSSGLPTIRSVIRSREIPPPSASSA